jgi:ABC-2 type transport system ATP-binding protein
MIMNIFIPDSGDIRILGKPFSENLKNRIGYLPEERGLYRKLKVSETLMLFGKLKGMSTGDVRTRGKRMLEEFDLDGYMDKKVEELSKGMSQKLQFIITILHQPEILILDEPFSGLDPVNIELVKNIILDKKKEGVSIIFSTHLMEYAEKIVDSVAMIHSGQKVLDGSLKEIKGKFGNRYVHVQYRGDSGFVGKLPYVTQVKDFGNEMEIELKDLSYKDKLLARMVDKLSISAFQITEPSLNNIFIRKVEEKPKNKEKG